MAESTNLAFGLPTLGNLEIPNANATLVDAVTENLWFPILKLKANLLVVMFLH
jgi:hypothetical protein